MKRLDHFWCPECGSGDIVSDNRHVDRRGYTYCYVRPLKCNSCKHKFKSFETLRDPKRTRKMIQDMVKSVNLLVEYHEAK